MSRLAELFRGSVQLLDQVRYDPQFIPVIAEGPAAAEETDPGPAADALEARDLHQADLAGMAHMGAAAG